MTDLDDILSGFDDQTGPTRKAQNSESNISEVLEGFDDEPKEGRGQSELEKVLTGFDEAPEKSKEGKPGARADRDRREKPDWLQLSGALSIGSSINFAHEAPEPGRTDHRGLSRLKTKASLEAKVKLSPSWRVKVGGHVFYDFAYAIKGRDEFTDDVLDDYEDEAELGEAYVQGALLPSLDLKAGRQIVVWGKSDNIRVTDILNPIDNREPGLVDIEDLRLPVTMTRLDYYFGDWNLCGIAIHEVRFNKDPQFGNDFFPSLAPLPKEEKPSTGIDNQEYAVALNGIFSGWDLSLYGAYLFDDQAHVEQTPLGLKRMHSRVTMFGAAANVALGNWLLKGEAACFRGLEFFSLPGKTKSRLDVMAGVEFSGFTDTTISFEIVNRHLLAFDDRLKTAPDNTLKNDFQTVFRLTRNFLHETLTLTFLASTFDLTGGNGAFQRLSLEYDLNEQVAVQCGVITYQSGDKPSFRNIDDNDRLFIEIKYSF
ncbi:MAG: hypothetical protein JRH00_15500 [Deltaproteobacteria bacterium]|nr:hypothetical protein [Deltaproteobacteria bacterium]